MPQTANYHADGICVEDFAKTAALKTQDPKYWTPRGIIHAHNLHAMDIFGCRGLIDSVLTYRGRKLL